MKKKLYVIASVTLISLLATGVALAGGGGAPRVTTLSGAEEVGPGGVPGAGDPDGSGFASVWLNHGQGRVCWEITFSDIAPPFAAHIHAAPAGVNGPVVVPLFPPIAAGCREVDRDLIKAIIQDPELYYVNVHNADFPGGALRGQLSNPGQSK
jgi:hypothetical protein